MSLPAGGVAGASSCASGEGGDNEGRAGVSALVMELQPVCPFGLVLVACCIPKAALGHIG